MLKSRTGINYQIFGEDSSPKLVFLHGIMGQGRNWQSIAKKFSQNYQCLIYDQRGHGRSFQPDRGYELDDYVEDLKNMLSELGWTDPIHLVGHSMGGRVALKFANTYKQMVSKLVIVDIGASSNWQSMASILEKLDFVPTPFASREAARQFMDDQFQSKYGSKMLTEFFFSNLVASDSQYDWIFSKEGIRQTLEIARHHDYWDLFRNLSMPTLLIRGELSPDLSQEDYEKIIANNPQIYGVVVEEAGHWVHAEKPRQTLEIIEDFFSIAVG